jgi:predicted Fe-Mo cluster-binding NifX family protein
MRTSLMVLFTVFFLMVGPAYAGSVERIAVAAEGKESSSMVSSVAARSPWYLIFDKNGNILEVVENPYKASRGSTAAPVLSFLSEKGVTTIVAGAFGEKMIQGMATRGMRHLEFRGSAMEASKKALEDAR